MKNWPVVRLTETIFDNRGYVSSHRPEVPTSSMLLPICAFHMIHRAAGRTVEFVSVNDYFVYMVAYLPNGKKYSTLVVTDEANHEKINLEAWDRYSPFPNGVGHSPV